MSSVVCTTDFVELDELDFDRTLFSETSFELLDLLRLRLVGDFGDLSSLDVVESLLSPLSDL